MQKSTEEIVVTGYDLFFYETSKKQANKIAKAIKGTARKFGGDGWCITHMLDEALTLERDELQAAIYLTTSIGRRLAEEYGGDCDGCELYVHGLQNLTKADFAQMFTC